PDGEYPEGDTSSVYFDTPDFRFLGEKDDGDNFKTKLRLRWYDVGVGTAGNGRSGGQNKAAESGGAEVERKVIPAFLEIKLRFGAARDKFRKRITIDAARAATAIPGDGFFESVAAEAARDWEPCAMIPPALPAMIIISYNRRRHICPFTGSRVALDTRIRAERFNPAFFTAPAPVAVPDTVCEFKNNTLATPPWLRALEANGFRLRSFSKYGTLCELAK
ncbi:MAG: VTC domain-containing protein, partial [Kiritimatiellaeota bacterium]|nr:VTC domain-containing protein [Kiritimatiellota bacterium]